MPSSRLSLRLGQLPHDVLAELAAQLCSESPALQAAAEECMASHSPLLHEMVERVLLSPDLVPSILAQLGAEDGAAAGVCTQWLVGWKATSESRRRLKQVPLDLPEELITGVKLKMTGTPDGRLVVDTGSTVHILDRSMRVLQTAARSHYNLIAADDDSIFSSTADGTTLLRCTYDGTTVAEFELEGYSFGYGVLAPGNLLFTVVRHERTNEATDEYDYQPSEIIALDAQTLQLRHRFGRGLLDEIYPLPLAVAGDELYVCDSSCEGLESLEVFSFTGEHRRSVVGAWEQPKLLCSAKDRLYMVEHFYGCQDGDFCEIPGVRLLVLSLQGDILQAISLRQPTDRDASLGVHSICCFEGKLLVGGCYERFTVSKYYDAGDPTTFTEEKNTMLALRGL